MTCEESQQLEKRIKETVFENLKSGMWVKQDCIEIKEQLNEYYAMLREREVLYDEEVPNEVLFSLCALTTGIKKFELWQKYNHNIDSHTQKPNTQTQKVILKQLLPGIGL